MLKDACIIEKCCFKKGIAVFDDFLFVVWIDFNQTFQDWNAKNVVFKLKFCGLLRKAEL